MQSKTESVLKSVVENNLGMRLSRPKGTRCLGTVASSCTYPMCCKIETAGASQALRGRKTDVSDRVCQIKLGSQRFIPPKVIRQLRELTHARVSQVKTQATERIHIHKRLRTTHSVLLNQNSYHDRAINYEMLMVERNASPWTRILDEYNNLYSKSWSVA